MYIDGKYLYEPLKQDEKRSPPSFSPVFLASSNEFYTV